MTENSHAVNQVIAMLNSIRKKESAGKPFVEATQLPKIEEAMRFVDGDQVDKQVVGLLAIACHYEQKASGTISMSRSIDRYFHFLRKSMPNVVRHAALRVLVALARGGVVFDTDKIRNILNDNSEDNRIRRAAQVVARYVMREQGK